MRLLVFFDLPVQEKLERREAAQFRNFLLKDGFYMVQYSVYCRICSNVEAAKTHEQRILRNLPHHGSVRLMIVTDKQYGDMRILLGTDHPNDKFLDEDMISFF